MKFTPTWIDSNLSRRERDQLVDWLMERTSNPTGEQIREGLAELFPALADDLPSLNSCLAWRNAAWKFELSKRELRAESAAAGVLADSGGGTSLDEANRVLLQSMIFEQLRALKEGRIKDVDPDALAAMAKSVTRLAAQGMAERELAAKLDKAQREKEAAERALKSAAGTAADDKLTPEERLRKIREGLKV